MMAFASNSLLARIALKETAIDPASFTTIRLVSGALMLWLIVLARGNAQKGNRNVLSALALFAYAGAFSFAYVSLPAGTGALLLFGAVQTTMIGHGIWSGERLSSLQLAGLLLAVGGLVGLMLPGISAASLTGSALMVAAGVAWGVYSLRGKGAANPIEVTAGNFLLAVPLTLVLSALMWSNASTDAAGMTYAVLSGALSSGVGYAIWYTVLPAMKTTHAATVQLSVPVIAAFGGFVFLGEGITVRLVLASAAILGGIALVILKKRGSEPTGPDPHSR